MQADDANHRRDATPLEVERVRRALAALGAEDVPGDVAVRLATLLAAQPALVARRRQRRRYALAGLAPALAAGVVAVVILASPSGSRHHPPASTRPAAALLAPASGGTAKIQEFSATASSAPQPPGPGGVADSMRARRDAVTPAARAAYDAAEATIRARRRKP